MLIQKTYKYRLHPTDQQAQRLRQLCGCAHFVWNYTLNETLSVHGADGKIPSAFDLSKRPMGWKKPPKLAFLSEGYIGNLRQKLRDLRNAWDRCFDRPLTVEKPVFKKKIKGCDSIWFASFSKYYELDYGRMKLPPELGWAKFRQSRKIEGVVKNCTINQHAGYWYMSFQVELAVTDPIHASTGAIDLDAGITKLATPSDGTVFEPVNSLRKNQDKPAHLQRRLARMAKFSTNWERQKTKISRLHFHITNTRRSYFHKAATTIGKNHAMIAVRDLKVSNTSKSAAGAVDQPGRNVAAKPGPNRAILDQSRAEMRRQLQYKQAWRGGDVLAIDPTYTGQKCVRCGHTSRNNRRTQASSIYTACGCMANTDVDGTCSILAAGFRVTAAGQILPSVRKGHARRAT